ncbi:MAG: hypothetical protein ACI9J2_001438 [Saprospiraceae bacterium]|jgi:hypothetical protein
MKWLAVLLVLVNVGSYFWIQREESIEVEVDLNKFEGINLPQMSLKASKAQPMKGQSVEDESITRIDLTQEAPKELTFVAEKPKINAEPVLEPKREPLPNASIDFDSLELFQLPAVNVQSAQHVAEQLEVDNIQGELKNITSKLARFCYRIGPYLSSGALNYAVSVIAANTISYVVPKVATERSIKAARVYLGPYDGQEAVDQMRAKLKEKRVEHYVLNSDSKRILQLGYFSGIKRGENYQSRLRKKGFYAKLEKIYQERLGDTWIHFEINAEARLKELDELKLYRAASVERRNCN